MNTEDLLKDIHAASRSSVEIELKSHYLLGETNEFDEFNPELVSEEFSSDFELFKYACCKYVGFRTTEDEQKANEVWAKLSAKQEVNSMLEYSADLFLAGDTKQAFKYLLDASRKGNLTAIFRMALCYHEGIYVKKDEKRGAQLIKLLAQKKYPDAVFYLSTMYAVGAGGVSFDEKKSEELLKESVELESKFGQAEYGFKLFITSEDNEERKKGFSYIRESADAGDPRAMLMLAILYAKEDDDAVEADEDLSKRFLIRACDLGYTPAQKLASEILKKSSDNNNN